MIITGLPIPREQGHHCHYQRMLHMPCGKRRIKRKISVFLPGFEPGTFRVSGERDNHYTTETTSDGTWMPPFMELSPPSSTVGSEPGLPTCTAPSGYTGTTERMLRISEMLERSGCCSFLVRGKGWCMAGHGTRHARPHHCSAKEVQASGLGGEDHRAAAMSTAIPFLGNPRRLFLITLGKLLLIVSGAWVGVGDTALL